MEAQRLDAGRPNRGRARDGDAAAGPRLLTRPTQRRSRLIRAAAVFVTGIITFAYAVTLLGLTWLFCYGTGPGCDDGWMPRTIATGVYLVAIGLVILLTRRSLRGGGGL